jgi:hypothetical protein
MIDLVQIWEVHILFFISSSVLFISFDHFGDRAKSEAEVGSAPSNSETKCFVGMQQVKASAVSDFIIWFLEIFY